MKENQAETEKYFDELSEKFSEKLSIVDENFPGIIFHYTDFHGLKGILKTRRLWLTSAEYLNDPSEGQYGFSQIINLIEEKAKTSKYSLFWKISNEIFNDAKQLLDLYVCSFCKKGNYLPAWRWYANDEAGFSIGFKKKFFLPTNNLPRDKKILVGSNHLHYSIEGALKECIDFFFEEANQTLNIFQEKKLLNPDSCMEISKVLITYSFPLFCLLKHEAYQEEQEYRMYMIEDKNNPFPADKKFWRTHKNMSEAATPFVNSIPTTFIEFDSEYIEEIWIGPKCNFEHAKDEIKKLLKEYGYAVEKIQISASEIPYGYR